MKRVVPSRYGTNPLAHPHPMNYSELLLLFWNAAPFVVILPFQQDLIQRRVFRIILIHPLTLCLLRTSKSKQQQAATCSNPCTGKGTWESSATKIIFMFLCMSTARHAPPFNWNRIILPFLNLHPRAGCDRIHSTFSVYSEIPRYMFSAGWKSVQNGNVPIQLRHSYYSGVVLLLPFAFFSADSLYWYSSLPLSRTALHYTDCLLI